MRATTRAAKVLTAVEGIYEDGEVELLERPKGLQRARVIVTFLPPATSEPSREREEARKRLLNLMREGIDLGGPPYPTREEIYERDPKA
ncbi:MAG TPA: hypothetical protein VGM86_30250 [Thermoanaerobaculia bacterium]